MEDNKNLMLAFGLSMLVLIGYDFFFLSPAREEAARQQQLMENTVEVPQPGTSQEFVGSENMAPSDMAPSDMAPSDMAPSDMAHSDSEQITPVGNDQMAPAGSRQQQSGTSTSASATQDAGHVTIVTPELEGSVSLLGAVFNDLVLVNHQTSLDADAKPVRLLRPADGAQGYSVRFGWAVQDRNGSFAPGPDSVWVADSKSLSPDTPVTLRYDNGAGVVFYLDITVDRHFMFTVTQRVENNSGDNLNIAPYGLIVRRGEPKTDGLFIMHEGPLGVFDGTLEERTYENLREDGNFEATSLQGGWVGITDKYWMTVLVPDQVAPLSRARMVRAGSDTNVRYRVDYVRPWQTVEQGATLATTDRFYAGAKIVSAIDRYEEQFGIALFDRTIDWGWFYFLTRPIFYGLDYLFHLVGNFGVAILLLTVAIKALLLPLANKSYVSMSRMKKVQPKMKQLQERFKDDKARLQQEMMALYKKEKINPLSGCMPLFLQIPVFFALYKVLYVTIEMRHQPFFGWIKDLSAPDPLTPVNLFGLLPFDPPSVIAIGIWPILMGVTMWLQQKMTPSAASMDPVQQKVMGLLPIIFTFILANFSAGLVIYWTWNSVLTIAQQWFIMRREEAKEG